MKLRILLLFFITIALSACQRPDEIMPAFSSITVNGQDESHFLVTAGTTAIVSAQFTDNDQLKQVMLKLTKSGEQHLMTGSTSGEIPFLAQLPSGAFDTTLIHSLQGNTQQHSFQVSFPNSINGYWKMTIAVLDQSGNLLSNNYPLHIHNDSIPSIALTSVHPQPASDGIVRIIHPDSLTHFRLNGYLVDQTGLDSINVAIKKNTATLWQQLWNPTPDTWSFPLQTIQIDTLLAAGQYELTITAIDKNQWKSVHTGKLIIQE